MNAILTEIVIIMKNRADINLLRAMIVKSGDSGYVQTFIDWNQGFEYLKQRKKQTLLFLDYALAEGKSQFAEILPRVSLRCPVIVLVNENRGDLPEKLFETGVQDVLVLSDVTSKLLGKSIYHAVERHRMRKQLHELAMIDPLTGLHNRRGFMARAELVMQMADRSNADVVVSFLDVDHMKWVNDNLGHREGDMLLIETASILRTVFRKADVIGRIGGDEFAVLAIRDQPDSGNKMLHRFEQVLKKYNNKRKGRYSISFSTGIIEGGQAKTLDTLLSEADKEMYHAKKAKQGQPPVIQIA